jgi:hypothetical protein
MLLVAGRSDRPPSSEEPPLPPTTPARRRAVAIANVGLVAMLLSGCSANPLSETLDRLQSNARELMGGGPTGSSSPSEGETDLATDETLTVGVSGLRVGDCYGEYDYDTGTVDLLPCDGPHIEEVYHEHRILEAAFPGDDRVWEIAERECQAAFEEYVGTSWEESVFSYQFWGPVEDSWGWGDRVILCTVYQPGVELEASARHSGR